LTSPHSPRHSRGPSHGGLLGCFISGGTHSARSVKDRWRLELCKVRRATTTIYEELVGWQWRPDRIYEARQWKNM
jgi:hypothetical protein